MKTAISVPNRIFESAEKMAKKLGMSRSKLFSTAMEAYLARYDDDQITAKLNEVYSVHDSSMDPVLAKMQAKTILKEDW